jgi:hypothetical protein
MALGTLSALETSIASWLARDDLTSVIPDAIALCEADFTRRIRVRQMEGRADSTASTQFEALPPDFLEMRSIRILSPDPGLPLDLVSPDYIDARWPDSTTTGRPQCFAIVGPEFKLGPAPDATYTLELDYYAFTPLSVSAPTNWLLTSHPDVYLYGSLLKIAPFTRKPGDMWQPLYDGAIADLIAADQRARWPMGKMVARPSGSTP